MNFSSVRLYFKVGIPSPTPTQEVLILSRNIMEVPRDHIGPIWSV